MILDDEIFLRARKDENPGGEQLESKAFDTLAEAADLANRTWSSPILFRFDGTAEDRTFRVMDEEPRRRSLPVPSQDSRGLYEFPGLHHGGPVMQRATALQRFKTTIAVRQHACHASRSGLLVCWK